MARLCTTRELGPITSAATILGSQTTASVGCDQRLPNFYHPPPSPLKTNPKAKYIPQTNRVGCSPLVGPLLASRQDLPEAFVFFTIKLSHSPACL